MNQNIYYYLKSYILYFIVLISYLIITSLLFYFELFNYKTLTILNFIASLIMFFILGFKISSLKRNKGYLNGFIISVILITIFVLISLIASKLTFSSLVYYLSLIISSMIGGIVGVGKKK